VWDVASREELRRLGNPERTVRQAVFAPDGRTLAVGDGNKVRLWKTADWAEDRPLSPFGEEASWPVPPWPEDVTTLAFAPGGGTLARGDSGGSVRLWCLTPRRSRLFRGPESWVEEVALSPDGKRLAALFHDTGLCVWDVATGKVHLCFPPFGGLHL